jgi:hypothetical protein
MEYCASYSANQHRYLQTRLRILAAFVARALLRRITLRCQRAQGRPGAGRAPTVHCAKVALQEAAQRHTGEAKQPAFPAQWFDGLCRALPGERCTIAPVALQMADARARSGRRITARLGAQTPGARTTRFCRTRTALVVRARRSLTVARPAMLFAPMLPASTAAHPAFVTIAIRPSDKG